MLKIQQVLCDFVQDQAQMIFLRSSNKVYFSFVFKITNNQHSPKAHWKLLKASQFYNELQWITMNCCISASPEEMALQKTTCLPPVAHAWLCLC